MHTRTPVIVCAVILFIAAPTLAQIENWVNVAPPGAAFFIKMPAQPQKNVKDNITQYDYTENPKTDKFLYVGIAVENLPLGAGEEYLKKEIDDFTSTLGGKTISTERHDYKKDSPTKQPYPGMLAKITKGSANCLVASYVVNTKNYTMCYCAGSERYSQAEAERFLDSFVLINY